MKQESVIEKLHVWSFLKISCILFGIFAILFNIFILPFLVYFAPQDTPLLPGEMAMGYVVLFMLILLLGLVLGAINGLLQPIIYNACNKATTGLQLVLKPLVKKGVKDYYYISLVDAKSFAKWSALFSAIWGLWEGVQYVTTTQDTLFGLQVFHLPTNPLATILVSIIFAFIVGYILGLLVALLYNKTLFNRVSFILIKDKKHAELQKITLWPMVFWQFIAGLLSAAVFGILSLAGLASLPYQVVLTSTDIVLLVLLSIIIVLLAWVFLIFLYNIVARRWGGIKCVLK